MSSLQQTLKRRRRRVFFTCNNITFCLQIVIAILSILKPSSSFVFQPLQTSNNQHPFILDSRQTPCIVMEATKKNKGLVVYKNKKKNISNTSTTTTNAVVKVATKAKEDKKRYMDDNSIDRILNGDDDEEEEEETSVPAVSISSKKKGISSFSKTMKHFTTLTSSSNTDRVLHANVKETGKDTMSQYFKSIGNHELLRHEDEIVLGKEIQILVKWEEIRNELEDDLMREPTMEEWATSLNETTASLKKQIKRSQRAKTALIEANLRLVISIARQNVKGQKTTSINFQDACQDGIIGLIKACERYDPTKDFRFSTYAHWWIKRQIQENLMKQSNDNKRAYNLPYHVLRKINHMKIMEVTLREANRGKVPSDQLLANKLEITVDKLNYYRKLSQEAISLDKQLSIRQGKGSKASGPSSPTSSTIYDITPDKENMTPIEDTDKQMLQHDVRRLINTLSPREQAVIRLRFGLMTNDSTPKTLESIAKRFRVSTDKIRLIEKTALSKLKQPIRSNSLKCWIE